MELNALMSFWVSLEGSMALPLTAAACYHRSQHKHHTAPATSNSKDGVENLEQSGFHGVPDGPIVAVRRHKHNAPLLEQQDEARKTWTA